jgi:hypothetical protein
MRIDDGVRHRQARTCRIGRRCEPGRRDCVELGTRLASPGEAGLSPARAGVEQCFSQPAASEPARRRAHRRYLRSGQCHPVPAGPRVSHASLLPCRRDARSHTERSAPKVHPDYGAPSRRATLGQPTASTSARTRNSRKGGRDAPGDVARLRPGSNWFEAIRPEMGG